MCHIYSKSNVDWDHDNKSKYGYVAGDAPDNLINRLSNSTDEHSDLSYYTNIWLIQKTPQYKLPYIEIDKIFSLLARSIDKIELLEKHFNILLPKLRTLNKHLVNGRSKNEFIYKNGISVIDSIIKNEFPKLGLILVKIYSQTELDEINNANVRMDNKPTDTDDFWTSIAGGDGDRVLPHIWNNDRNYQKDIIKLGIDKLNETNKFYLELATGGGKSYIVYKLLNYIKSETIIIFSPRKTINMQNISNKYLSILDDKYLVYNNSSIVKFDEYLAKSINKKRLIIVCTQSYSTIFNNIKELKDITIWFDESHWSVETWLKKKESDEKKKESDEKKYKIKEYFLKNIDNIKKRIFTSASPNHDLVKQYMNTFGEIYCPIKVKQLIDLKWLCPIKCRILEHNYDSLNLIDWILTEFYKLNKHFGFSFHSRDNNAFILFYKHYKLFMNEKISIKPYLLIDKCGLDDKNKKALKKINLSYDFSDIHNFEENILSIGYVCKKFDIGYDFSGLDFIVFSDPKMSPQDIKQCIGRGTRPDGKGEQGKNLDKILSIMLPVYIIDDKTTYNNIVEVLRYLILDLDIDIEGELINNSNNSGPTVIKSNSDVNYKGVSNSSKLLDILYGQDILKRPTKKTLYKFCRKYNIQTEADYNKFKQENKSIPLKSNIYEYIGFKWKDILDPNGEKYYITRCECEIAEKAIFKKISDNCDENKEQELYDDQEINGWFALHKYDPKIPPVKLLDYYY